MCQILGLSLMVSLFAIGILPTKLIGVVYVHNDSTKVKLSYLNIWGDRKDQIMLVSDLVPLSDLPAVPMDPLYLTLRCYSSKDTYKMNLKYGIILDKVKFENVFKNKTM